jgi:hypothetical protein
MKIIIMQHSPASRHFLPLRRKHSLQHSVHLTALLTEILQTKL